MQICLVLIRAEETAAIFPEQPPHTDSISVSDPQRGTAPPHVLEGKRVNQCTPVVYKRPKCTVYIQ